MAETLATVTGVVALLETSLKLVERFRAAYIRQRELALNLETWYNELSRTLDLVAAIREEPTLQTENVAVELSAMDRIGRRLVELLTQVAEKSGLDTRVSVEKKRGKAQAYLHQAIGGKRDEERIKSLMGEMSRCKTTVALRVELAHVGVTRTVERGLVMNAEAIERVDAMLRLVLGHQEGLRIKSLVRTKQAAGDTEVPVGKMELLSLNSSIDSSIQEKNTHSTSGEDSDCELDGIDVGEAWPTKIITGNMTYDQAIQINSPIDTDNWITFAHLDIRDNKACGHAVQINSAMSGDAFTALLAHRKETMT